MALANRLIGNGAGNAFHTSYTDIVKSLVRKVLYKEGTVKEDHTLDVLIVEKYYMKKIFQVNIHMEEHLHTIF